MSVELSTCTEENRENEEQFQIYENTNFLIIIIIHERVLICNSPQKCLFIPHTMCSGTSDARRKLVIQEKRHFGCVKDDTEFRDWNMCCDMSLIPPPSHARKCSINILVCRFKSKAHLVSHQALKLTPRKLIVDFPG